MRARLRGPAPPSASGALRSWVLRSTSLRSWVLGPAGVCALLAGGATPAAAAGSLITVVVVDNSNADSWLEIDRTANLQNGSGSAGSDHDGAGSLVGGLLGRSPGPGSSGGPALHPAAGGGP